jgi:hypothetical protein
VAKEIFEIIFDADGSKATNAFSQVGASAKKELGDAEKSASGFLDSLTKGAPGASSAVERVALSGEKAVQGFGQAGLAASGFVDGVAAGAPKAAGAIEAIEASGGKAAKGLDAAAASSQSFVSNVIRDLPAASAGLAGVGTSTDEAAGSFTRLSTTAKKGLGDAKSVGKDLADDIAGNSSPKIVASLGRIGTAAEDLGSKFHKALPGAAGDLQSFGAKLSGTADLFGAALPTAVVVGGVAIGAFAAKATADFQNLAQETLHFQQIAGGTADEASRWVQTADDFGVSTEQLSGAMGKFEVSIGKSPEKLAALGVEIAHTKDGGVDLQGTFFNVIDAYNATTDETQKASIAQAAFGKQWQGLVKLLDAGADSVRADFKSISAAQRLDQGDLQASEHLRVALDNLQDTLQGVEVSIGKLVVPALADLADELGTVLNVAAKVGGNSGFGLIASAARDALDPIGRVTRSWQDLRDRTAEIQTVTPHIVSFTQATQAAGLSGAQADTYIKAMDSTFKEIDKSAAEATKEFAAHDQALADLAIQYGTFGAAAISNAGLSTDALNNMAKEGASFRDSMFNAFHGATGPMDEFANASTVTAAEFMKSLQDQEQAAETWAANLQAAADAGINQGFIEKLAEAGPKAAPILTALLDAVHRGDTNAINQLLQDTDNALTQGANAVLNHKPEWSNAGVGVGSGLRSGVTSQVSGLGAELGPALAAAASLARANSLPSFIDAGVALGRALSSAAAQSAASARASAAAPPSAEARGAKAAGGVLSPGLPTLVGEKGVELIVPGIQPKTVIPNNVLRGGLGGGVNATININAPVYGVDDLQGAIYGALDDVRRRAMAGAR